MNWNNGLHNTNISICPTSSPFHSRFSSMVKVKIWASKPSKERRSISVEPKSKGKYEETNKMECYTRRCMYVYKATHFCITLHYTASTREDMSLYCSWWTTHRSMHTGKNKEARHLLVLVLHFSSRLQLLAVLACILRLLLWSLLKTSWFAFSFWRSSFSASDSFSFFRLSRGWSIQLN